MLGWIMTGAIPFGIVELAVAREQWRLRLPGAAAWS